ncbi:MAG: malonic semialdehyde reductase [Actinomycetales bacterium]|nr:malonic semialdehyde reductase [Actinomycetales bacterium]
MTALMDTVTRGIDDRAADLLFRDAQTAYRFTDQPVTPAELDRLHDLLQFPPTAMNIQPLRVVLLTDESAKARLVPYLAEGNRSKSASAPVVAILAADTDFHEHLPRLAPHAPGAKDRFADDGLREQAARFNATLQAGYFILAVRAVGLDAGPMGGFDMLGVDRDLLGDGALRSFLIVNIGHAAEDGTRPRSPRLEKDEVFLTL